MIQIEDYNINEGFYEFWPWDSSIHTGLTEAILSTTSIPFVTTPNAA